VKQVTTAQKILLVDDVASNLRILRATLEREHYDPVEAHSGIEALSLCSGELPAMVLLDLHMPEMDGFETLRRLKAIAPELPVVIITGDNDIAAAVRATKLGAYDYLIRPVEEERLLLIIRHALERSSLRDQVENLRHRVSQGGYLSKLILPSPTMRQVADQIIQVAQANLTVLIQGRTGTGKEVVARAIHQESARADKPFVAVDCGAIPDTLVESELFGFEKGAFSGADRRKDGYFQVAQGGTLFLDETANLSLTAQAKLLRVIQERQVMPIGASRALPVDVRLIAATNARLEDKVRDGAFREDLYYRLAEFVIELPALKDRPDDVLALARSFVEEASLELHRSVSGVDEEAARLLASYWWPGNVRELRNLMRRAVLQASQVLIQEKDIKTLLAKAEEGGPVAAEETIAPPSAVEVDGRSLKEIANAAQEAAEIHAIKAALQTARGNKSSAAKLLKIDYKTLFTKLHRYGM
jgi:DNA-binding NtrC family response regulator